MLLKNRISFRWECRLHLELKLVNRLTLQAGRLIPIFTCPIESLIMSTNLRRSQVSVSGMARTGNNLVGGDIALADFS